MCSWSNFDDKECCRFACRSHLLIQVMLQTSLLFKPFDCLLWRAGVVIFWIHGSFGHMGSSRMTGTKCHWNVRKEIELLMMCNKAIMSRGHPRLLLLLLLYVLIDLDSIKQKHGKWCLLSLLPQSNYAQFTHLWKRANLFNILRQKYTGKCSKKTKTEILYWPQDTSLTLQSTFFSPDWLHSMDDISIVPTGLELASVVITFKLCFNMIFMSPV